MEMDRLGFTRDNSLSFGLVPDYFGNFPSGMGIDFDEKPTGSGKVQIVGFGSFQNLLPNGWCYFVSEEGKHMGFCKNGEANGYGTFYDEKANVHYEGTFEHGSLNGFVISQQADGTIFKVQVKDDEWSGIGYYYATRDMDEIDREMDEEDEKNDEQENVIVVQGDTELQDEDKGQVIASEWWSEFKDHSATGIAYVLDYNEETKEIITKYRGDVVDGIMHGFGCSEHANSSYTGQFENNRVNGYGVHQVEDWE